MLQFDRCFYGIPISLFIWWWSFDDDDKEKKEDGMDLTCGIPLISTHVLLAFLLLWETFLTSSHDIHLQHIHELQKIFDKCHSQQIKCFCKAQNTREIMTVAEGFCSIKRKKVVCSQQLAKPNNQRFGNTVPSGFSVSNIYLGYGQFGLAGYLSLWLCRNSSWTCLVVTFSLISSELYK